MDNDKYGRTVTMETVGPLDIYTVGDDLFEIKYPTGTDVSIVYNAINAMAPADYEHEVVSENAYRGKIQIQTQTLAPFTLSLPEDLTTGFGGSYPVGKNNLDVFLNGQKLLLGADFAEVGDPGTVSSQIEILVDCEDEDFLEFQGK